MNRLILLIVACLTSFASAIAQDSDTKKVKQIKIVTVDEDGNKKEIVKEFELSDTDIEWYDEDGGKVKVIVRTGEDEEEEIIVDVPHIKMMKHASPFLGVILGEATDIGVAVSGIVEGSAAAEAGLKKGDIITAIDNESVVKADGLVEIIVEKEVGEKIEVEFLRENKKQTTTATLKERNEDFEFAMGDVHKNVIVEIDGDEEVIFMGDGEVANKAFLGIYPANEVEDITGVMIEKTVDGSAAKRAGLQTGDVITKIDEVSISNFDDLKMALKDRTPGDEITISYLRQGKKKSAKAKLTPRHEEVKEHIIIKEK